jgi:cholest-4-en-3-one 26-monooxygenase
VGALLNAKLEGECLTDDEFRSFFLLLIVAGNETTRTATTHGMRLLMEHPDQYEMLVDNPEMVDGAIEEILRYNAPIQCMRRTAMQDHELGGAQIKQGDKIVMFYQSGNHDESIFDSPEKFDITRSQREEVRNAHRSFGVGEHFCLGSHLARLELKVVFSELIKTIRNPRLVKDPIWIETNFINGIREMHMAYDVVNAQ